MFHASRPSRGVLSCVALGLPGHPPKGVVPRYPPRGVLRDSSRPVPGSCRGARVSPVRGVSPTSTTPPRQRKGQRRLVCFTKALVTRKYVVAQATVVVTIIFVRATITRRPSPSPNRRRFYARGLSSRRWYTRRLSRGVNSASIFGSSTASSNSTLQRAPMPPPRLAPMPTISLTRTPRLGRWLSLTRTTTTTPTRERPGKFEKHIRRECLDCPDFPDWSVRRATRVRRMRILIT